MIKQSWIFLFLSVWIFSPAMGQKSGDAIVRQMNGLIEQHSGVVTPPMTYYEQYARVELKILKTTYRFAWTDFSKAEVIPVGQMFEVKFSCPKDQPCVIKEDEGFSGTYMNNYSFYFNNAPAANGFAKYASEICAKDFNKKLELGLYGNDAEQNALYQANMAKRMTSRDELEKKPESKPAKGNSHLRIDSYDDDANDPEEPAERMSYEERRAEREQIREEKKEARQRQSEERKERNEKESESGLDVEDYQPGKRGSALSRALLKIIESGEQDMFTSIRETPSNGVYTSKIKLPKAKKNYLNAYQGVPCFIAEFGSKNNQEDLEELYFSLLEQVSDGLGEDWEEEDMGGAAIYSAREDEVYHTDYYNTAARSKPSVSIMIVPDSGKYTLFVRVGKR